jgi:transcription elongation factor Elf1
MNATYRTEELMEFCAICGAENDSCKPDSLDCKILTVRCGDCGAYAVYGAEELIMAERVG